MLGLAVSGKSFNLNLAQNTQ